MQVTKIITTTHEINNGPELQALVAMMKQRKVCKDPMALLPKVPWHTLSFVLSNTNSGFANAVRRTLVGELRVKCLDFDASSFGTNDDFLLEDFLHKMINLIPIYQHTGDDVVLHLDKQNTTNKTISVLASDLSIRGGGGKRGGSVREQEEVKHGGQADEQGSDQADAQEQADVQEQEQGSDEPEAKHGGAVGINKIIPDGNFEICRLRPRMSVQIGKIVIRSGYSMDDAGRFSLLANVKYRPLDVVPFNQFTGEGTRSIMCSPKEFGLSFTTTSNVTPRHVIDLLTNTLRVKLTTAQTAIATYGAEYEEDPKDYREVENMNVTISEGLSTYAFTNEYITLVYMLASACFAIAPDVLFVAPAVDRYDTRIGIVRIKHPEANAIMLEACAVCLRDIETLHEQVSAALRGSK